MIETDAEADGFRQFEKEFRRLREQLTQRLDLPESAKAPEAILQRRLEKLVAAFESVLKRSLGDHDDGYHHREALALQQCVELIVKAPNTPGKPADPKTPQDACVAGLESGAVLGVASRRKAAVGGCPRREYDLLIDAVPLERHNLLVGPLLGVPITKSFGDLTYGAGLEFG